MEAEVMKREDWTMLAIAAAEGEPLGPVQLQKSLFLLGQADSVGSEDESFYRFSKYHYGPFSREIYYDADALERQRMVIITRDGPVRQYRASAAGLERARQLEDIVPASAIEYLGRVVRWACTLTFRQLVRSIYAQFPEYEENSVFAG